MMRHINDERDEQAIFNVFTSPTLTIIEHRKFTEEVIEDLRDQAETSLIRVLSPLCDEELVRGTGETAKQKFVRIALSNNGTGAKGKDWLGYEDLPDVAEYLAKMWDKQYRGQFKRFHVDFQVKLHAEIPSVREVYYDGAEALEELKASLGDRCLLVCGMIWVARKVRERVARDMEALADTVRGVYKGIET